MRRGGTASVRVVVVIVLLASPVGAQEQGGSIEGTVRDALSAGIPGAIVEARGAGGLVLTTVSGSAGTYRFPSLPPGRYRLTARLSGLAPAQVANIPLHLGQVLEVDLVLVPAGAESVTVTGDPPLIDVRQSARSTSIRDEQVTRLPRGRDFTSLVIQATGANPEGAFAGISIDGASGSENRFIVDGIETTHVMTGGSGMGMVTDFVDEVQVKSSGYAAEHAGATGGVINVITRSGTNHWASDLGVYYVGEWLQGKQRRFLDLSADGTRHEYRVFGKDIFDRWEPGLALSGPLKRDRAWLFAAYHPAFLSTERTVTFRANGETGTFANTVDTQNATANVVAQVTNTTRLRIAFAMSPSIEDGTLPFENGNSSPTASYAEVTRRSNHSLSASADHALAPNVVVSVRGAHWFANTSQEGIHQGPRYFFQTSNIGMEGVPTSLQGPRGTTNVASNNQTTRNILTRTGLQLDGTWFVSARGRHAVKAGLQLQRIGNDLLMGETGNFVQLHWGESRDGQRGPFGYYMVRSSGESSQLGFGYDADVHSDTAGLFVQDAWTVRDRLTLNVGLRAERERIPSFTTADGIQPTAIDFEFGDKLAPRLGVSWDVSGDGKSKVYGSWGIFYDVMKYQMPRDLLGGFKWFEHWYTLDTPEWSSLMRAGCPPACPGTLIRGPVNQYRPSNEAIDPDLEPFRLQEATVGGEHALTRSMSIAVRYVHKQVDRAIEDIGTVDADGNRVYTIGNPGFHRAAQTGFGPRMPKAIRDYDALELTVDKRMADGWSLRAGYLWSRLFGNYTGLAGAGGTFEAEGTPSANRGQAFNHPMMAFGEDGRPVLGALAADRIHQLKMHAVYDFEMGLSLGTSVRVMSGAPVTRGAPFGRAGHPVKYRGYESDGRLPTLSQVDLYAQHRIGLSGDRHLLLSLNVSNLFDRETPLLRYTNAVRGAIAIDEAAFFRGFDTDALIVEQRLRADPLFLQDYGFQAPREIRLGVKLFF